MKKKPIKKAVKAKKKPVSKKKKTVAKRAKPTPTVSRTRSFMEKLRSRGGMVEYFTSLRILNPAAEMMNSTDGEKREGGYVRLAHARDEFKAPVLKKGKAVWLQEQEKKKKKKSKAKT